MIRTVLACLLIAGYCPVAAPSTAVASRVQISNERRVSFNEGWRFLKAEAEGAQDPAFDDSKWTEVRLPHDWAIDGPFDSKLNPHTGALPISGTGWYRKTFVLPDNLKDRYWAIEFDGAMSNAHVWLNGRELGSRPYGYIGFAFDLTPSLRFGGQQNVLAVRLTPEDHSSRWYPGAGIYRNVWLDCTSSVHVAHWGVYVTTPDVSDEKSTVSVRTDVRNHLGHDTRVTLRTSVVDADGKRVSQGEAGLTIPADATQTAVSRLTIARPKRWDVDHPYLYKLISEVIEGKTVVDRYETPFGVRTIAFDKDKGFLLNGRHLKLQGVCMHHDLGALGAAVNRRATERQLEIMKSAGVNAVRTSHNPPSPELLELADQMGLLVMDEAFDMWHIPKVPNGYSKYFDDWSERDARDMVRRDRNHPSVILWSIGNEVPEQGKPDGWQQAKRLVNLFHEEDPTRPTTSAFNSWSEAIQNKLADQVDIPGFNYQPMHYEQILKEHPGWIIVASETASCVSSRGTYHLPLEKYEKDASLELSSYDIIAPRWAYCPDVEFASQDRFPNVLGEFVWTGFDYLGEPTPYFWGNLPKDHDWPARSSYFGMVDLAGFPKDRYYLYQSVWSKQPMVHLLPHWNWHGKEGQNIPVMCYSNGDEVELFLNGKSLGRKKRFSELVELPVGPNVSPDRKFQSKYRFLWQAPFETGVLKAVAYQNGKPVASEEVRTAGPAAQVKLVPDRTTIQADGDDLSFVTVRIEDKDGNLAPEADNLVHFAISGPGVIAAVDNGNAATVEPFHADQRRAFNGMALLIIRSRPGETGQINISATSEGTVQGETRINSVKAPQGSR